MSKAEANQVTRKHGRTKGVRSLIKGRKVSNLLTLGINTSNQHKLRSSQLERQERIQKIHSRTEDHSNVVNVEDPTCIGIVHLRMRMQGQHTIFKSKK